MRELMKNNTMALNRRGLLKRMGAMFATAALIGAVGSSLATKQAHAETQGLEKEDLKFGFIKLTDMAPLAIAYEKGYFEDEGLFVTLEAQANWKVLLDRVIDGELDGAHMLAGQPLAATIGFGTKADIITAAEWIGSSRETLSISSPPFPWTSTATVSPFPMKCGRR